MVLRAAPCPREAALLDSRAARVAHLQGGDGRFCAFRRVAAAGGRVQRELIAAVWVPAITLCSY